LYPTEELKRMENKTKKTMPVLPQIQSPLPQPPQTPAPPVTQGFTQPNQMPMSPVTMNENKTGEMNPSFAKNINIGNKALLDFLSSGDGNRKKVLDILNSKDV